VQGLHKLGHSFEKSARSETTLRPRHTLLTKGSNNARTGYREHQAHVSVDRYRDTDHRCMIWSLRANCLPPPPPPSNPRSPDLTAADFFSVRLHQRTMYPSAYHEPLMKCERELLQPWLRWSGWDIVRVMHLYSLKLYWIQCTLFHVYRSFHFWDTFRKVCTY
jgi:hypothetical protein